MTGRQSEMGDAASATTPLLLPHMVDELPLLLTLQEAFVNPFSKVLVNSLRVLTREVGSL